jgi:uncharacterized membrane protein
MKKIFMVLFVLLAILVGLFPFVFYTLSIPFGIMNLKSEMVLSNLYWEICFHTHIIFGAIALLIGWIQLVPKLRNINLKLHLIIGKTYITSVLISAIASLFISFYSNGGKIVFIGLITGGIIWIITTLFGYYYILKKKISLHQKMMTYSYAVTFGGVTLRIWLPLLTVILNDFETAYSIAIWLAWLPNLFFANHICAKKTTN